MTEEVETGCTYRLWKEKPGILGGWSWVAYRNYKRAAHRQGLGIYAQNSDEIGSGYAMTKWGAKREARRAVERNETRAELKRRTTEEHGA
jgi:hypothetical protein